MRLRHRVVIVLYCLILPYSTAFSASEVFESTAHKVKLTVPEGFRVSGTKAPGLVVSINPSGSNFPTFNVTVVPGKTHLNRPITTEVSKIVDEYHKVGLRTAKAIGMQPAQLAKRPAVQVELNYEKDRQIFASIVYSVPTADRTFYFTFVDSAADLNNHRPLLDAILDTVEFLQPAPKTGQVQHQSKKKAADTAPKKEKEFPLFSLILLAAAGGAVGIMIARGKSKKKGSA